MCGICGLGLAAAVTEEDAAAHLALWPERAASVLADSSGGELEFNAFNDIPSGTGTNVFLNTGQRINAQISQPNDTDWFAMQLEAGQTYQVSLRALPFGGLGDAKVFLFDNTGSFLLTDDDSGDGNNALLTFTATRSGVYFAGATGFGKDGQSTGNYEISLGEANFDDDTVGDIPALAGTIASGETVSGRIDYSDDEDWYAITVEKGESYLVIMETDRDGPSPIYFPDSSRLPNPKLSVVDDKLREVAFNDDNGITLDAALTFKAKYDGVYYIKALGGPGNTGNFKLSVSDFSPPEPPAPADALDWGVQFDKTQINVYFAKQGETFNNELTDVAWNDYEKQQAMAALREYSKVSKLTFLEVDATAQADFFMTKNFADTSTTGRMIPQDPSLGQLMGHGWFNTDPNVWSREPGGFLEQGAFGYSNFIHESGHGLGLAHPHDNGGTSFIFAGVAAPADFGTNQLNQEVFTVMSYNKGWKTGLNGGSNTNAYGIARTPMAFDIAKIQEKYGVNETYNNGKNTYVLWDKNDVGTGYETIWDTGGLDRIVNESSISATIDLRSATLKQEPGGGGFVSFATGIFGGYTIANGVKIEQAFGGSSADSLIGNRFANLLDGRGGKDFMLGGKGNDTYVISEAGDVVSELRKGGKDTLKSKDISLSLADYNNVENIKLAGRADLDATGSGGANLLKGNRGDNDLTGKGRNDVIKAGGGNDMLRGDGGNDTLKGQGGNDKLIGGGGADKLDGSKGNDRLTGGKGSDDFIFGKGFGKDTITDFTKGQDELHLSAKIWTGTLTAAGVVDKYASVVNGDVVFDFGSGGTITLNGVGSLNGLADDLVIG